MLGWFSEARTCASRWKRATRSGSCVNSVGQELQRHVATEPRVAGAVDLAHAAGAQQAGDLVGAEAGAWRKAARDWRGLYGERGAERPRRKIRVWPSPTTWRSCVRHCSARAFSDGPSAHSSVRRNSSPSISRRSIPVGR